ncbi:30S ribosome-binding factor RbfA [Helicobacter sp. 11S03491-1]|uniref:30S ribosome-binding factor RbfA n=1 Tax=Helicobacter sp. 11S03491-1 TaxID=1476196 RepID=UPI000BA6A50D|nr:30S ribosome-binding factor RbfA [Helicobacter sp. 11S03491-1]PAF43338.1 ribosome-binding factor A [Helicobacter sp. 11S03491-1]
MDKSIRLQRTQSVLKEMIQEGLATLNDTRLNSLSILEVRCSKGKYNAEVSIYSDFYTQKEQEQILHHLKKAEGILKEYILQASSWYKCPKLCFYFDKSIEKAKNLDSIFDQIAKEKTKEDGHD